MVSDQSEVRHQFLGLMSELQQQAASVAAGLSVPGPALEPPERQACASACEAMRRLTGALAALAAPPAQPEAAPPVMARFVEGSWHSLQVDEEVVRKCSVGLPLQGPRRFYFLCPAAVREQVARGEIQVTEVRPTDIYERFETPEGVVYHCAPRAFEDALESEPGYRVISGSIVRPRG